MAGGTRALALGLGLVSVGAFPSPATPSDARFEGWRQVRTEHFTIIFEPRDEVHAYEVAAFAEEHYRQVTEFFGSYPRRIPVVLRGRVDVDNGFAGALPPAITLHVGAPYRRDFGVHGSRWLELVFVHELTHFVHLSMQSGPWQWLSWALGSTGPWLAGMTLPTWLIEGAAVYAETAYTDAGRGRNEFFTILSKAPIVEGAWFDRWRAGYPSPFPPRGRHYVAGYLLVEHLQRRYGERTIVRIMEDYLRFPFFGPWEAIRRVTGRSYRELWDDLEEELGRRYTTPSDPGGDPVGPVGVDLARASQAGDADRAPPQLYLGPATAAGVLAYRTSLTQPPDLVRMRAERGPDGSHRVQVDHLAALRLADPHSLAATEDGATVVYAGIRVRRDRPSGSEITSDLYRLDTSTGTRRQLTDGAHLWHPALSADGQVLVAVQGVGPHSRLVRVDLDSGELRELAAVEAGVMLHPTVRDDGAVVVFELSHGRHHDLYALPLDVGTRRPRYDRPLRGFNDAHLIGVTGPDESAEFFPRFGASGESLLFGSDRNGELALYRIETPRGSWQSVVEDPVGAFAGVEAADDLYYAAYTAAGDTVRRLPLVSAGVAGVRNVAEPAITAAPLAPAAASVAALPPTQVHLDLPIPSLWLPIPSLLFTDDGIDLGFGAGLVATAVRATSQLIAAVAYHPALGQPVGGADFALSAGRVRVGYAGALDYEVDGGSHARTALHTAQMRLALLDDVLHHRSTSQLATVWAGVGHSRVRTGVAPLPLSAASGAEIDAVTVAGVGAGADWRRAGSPKDLFSPLALRAAVALQSQVDAWQPLLRGALSVQVPTFRSHVARLRLHGDSALAHGGSLAAAWASSSAWRSGSPLTFLTQPASPWAPVAGVRGGFDLGPAGQTRLVGALDYMMTLALLDLPLLGVANVTAVTAGLHVEAVANWDQRGGAQLGERVFVGLELGAVLGAGIASLPVGAGVAVAVPDGEVRPYVFLGLTPELPLLRMGASR